MKACNHRCNSANKKFDIGNEVSYTKTHILKSKGRSER